MFVIYLKKTLHYSQVKHTLINCSSGLSTVLCISTSFWVLAAPGSWSKHKKGPKSTKKNKKGRKTAEKNVATSFRVLQTQHYGLTDKLLKANMCMQDNAHAKVKGIKLDYASDKSKRWKLKLCFRQRLRWGLIAI